MIHCLDLVIDQMWSLLVVLIAMVYEVNCVMDILDINVRILNQLGIMDVWRGWELLIPEFDALIELLEIDVHWVRWRHNGRRNQVEVCLVKRCIQVIRDVTSLFPVQLFIDSTESLKVLVDATSWLMVQFSALMHELLVVECFVIFLRKLVQILI